MMTVVNHSYPTAPRPPAGRRPAGTEVAEGQPEWAWQRLSKYEDAKTLSTEPKFDPF